MYEPLRPAATEADKVIFNQLLQKISAVDTYFCCGGTLQLVNRPLTLFYQSKSPGDNDNWLKFGDLYQKTSTERQTAIDKLLEACVPAPHGRGEETVLDESYRLARELRQDEFALSVDVLSEVGSGILSSISALTAGRLGLSKRQDQFEHAKEKDSSVPNLTIIPQLYKLNAYAKGGFFKPHRDTPKGSHHIGTLMLALPVAHQGGVLRVKHDGKEIFFDWGQQCSQGIQVSEEGQSKISIPWAFLFSDVEHEVSPVESGTRITIAFDIFSYQIGVNVDPPAPDMDGAATPFYDDLVDALRNPEFLTNGAKVAIALSHSYPMVRQEMELTDKEFALGLKGVDAIVYRALRAAGFNVSLRAVMTQAESDYSYDSRLLRELGVPNDGYDPALTPVSGDLDATLHLFTAETFNHTDLNPDVEVEFGEFGSMIGKHFGATPSLDLMWVKKPKDTLVNAGSYLAHSNEYRRDFVYAAAAFILDVPPFGKGSRRLW